MDRVFFLFFTVPFVVDLFFSTKPDLLQIQSVSHFGRKSLRRFIKKMLFYFIFAILLTSSLASVEDASKARNFQRLFERFEADPDIKRLREDDSNRRYIDYWINLFNSTDVDIIAEILTLPQVDNEEGGSENKEDFVKTFSESLTAESESKAVEELLGAVAQIGAGSGNGNVSTVAAEEVFQFLQMGNLLIEILRQMEALQELEGVAVDFEDDETILTPDRDDDGDEDEDVLDIDHVIEKNEPLGPDLVIKEPVRVHHPRLSKALDPDSSPLEKKAADGNGTNPASVIVTVVFVVFAMGLVFVVAVKRSLLTRWQVRIRNYAFRRMRD